MCLFRSVDMLVWFLVCLSVVSCARSNKNEFFFDRYIITCHTTDFECFKLQYKALRDNLLLGNIRMGIPEYADYVFAYGGGTCVKMSGLQESELVAITLLSTAKRLTLVIELPLRLHQVKETTKPCARPRIPFNITKPQTHTMRFTGNATIAITYPFKLKKQQKSTFMYLEDENLDVILDIPDLRNFYRKSEVEARLYEWSEWAYKVVQHVDAAEYFALPYTRQLRTIMKKLPLHRSLFIFIMLYPDETYQDLHFTFSETSVRTNLRL